MELTIPAYVSNEIEQAAILNNCIRCGGEETIEDCQNCDEWGCYLCWFGTLDHTPNTCNETKGE